MSAPNTDIEKQNRRHRPVLIGIAVVVVFAAVVFILNVGFSINGEGPLDATYGDDAPALKSDPEQ